MRRLALLSTLCILALGITAYGQNKTNNSPIVGTWNCVAHGSETGDQPFTLYIEHSSEGYTGSASAPQGPPRPSRTTN